MRKGFSLIELLVAITIIAIVSGVILFVANPAKQMAQARNTERSLNLQAIINGVGQNIADQSNEQFACASGSLPTSSKVMASGGASGTYDIAQCLVPMYLPTLPFDPVASSANYVSNTSYNTGYSIMQSSTTRIVTITAPYAELGKTISTSHGW